MEQGQEMLRFSLEPRISLSEQSPMGHCMGLWLETNRRYRGSRGFEGKRMASEGILQTI